MGAWIYILECADGSLYTGTTHDLDKIVNYHNSAKGSLYTQTRLPIKLIYQEYYDDEKEADRRATQIQGWTRRKKWALVKGEIENLEKYAECQNHSHSKYFKKETK